MPLVLCYASAKHPMNWFKCFIPVLNLSISLMLFTSIAKADELTLPPSGDNQVAAVTQGIGPVRVTINYSSPDVTGPQGEERKGKIWGELVPYGMVKQNFGTCAEACPWRAGANENTTITLSHDVEVEGSALAAGTYGLHMIPGAEEWTVIFSKNADAWGSYYYNKMDDALRVKVRARKTSYNEWLTYEFVERKPKAATFALRWEYIEVPVRIVVPNINEIYLSKIRNELTGPTGFRPESWREAAEFCLKNNINLKEGLRWAEAALKLPFIGEESFQNLVTFAALQEANGMKDEAKEVIAKALKHPSANATEIHRFARQLQERGRKQEALKIFKANAKRYKGAWPTNVGLARGYSAVGNLKKALNYAKKALKQAPDDLNKRSVKSMIEKLSKGEPLLI